MTSWSWRPRPSMSQGQFLQWQELLSHRFGIEIPEHRKVYLETRLIMRMREISCDDYDSYYEQMTTVLNDDPEWVILVDRLTIHETKFFRDPAAFNVVESYIKDSLLNKGLGKPITVWSVGCSSGEEPYSLAFIVDSCLAGSRYKGLFSVTATDISELVLVSGRRGVFASNKLASLKDFIKQKYFIKQEEQSHQVKASIREKVYFARVNAVNPEAIERESMDIIFCQNLLIYFCQKQRQEIVGQLIQRLTPGGLLVLGISDMVGWTHHQLRPAYTSDVLAFTRRKDED